MWRFGGSWRKSEYNQCSDADDVTKTSLCTIQELWEEMNVNVHIWDTTVVESDELWLTKISEPKQQVPISQGGRQIR